MPDPTADLRLQLAQDAARLGYWDLDARTGDLVWDETCAELLGTTLAEFEGDIDGFDRRCHPEDLPRVRAALAAAGPGHPMEVTFRILLPDGSERHLLSRGQAHVGPDGTVDRVVGVVLDVTALHRTVDQAAEAAARVSALAHVALAMAGTRTEDDLTRVVIEQGAAALGADGGAVCVRDDSRGVIRLAMTESLGVDVQTEYAELPLDGPLPGSFTARTGTPVFLPDRASGLAFSPAMQVVYDGTDRDAWAVLPLYGEGTLLGSLVVSWAEPRGFDDDERALLAAFAAQTGQALQRIQVLQADRERAEEARKLTEMLQRSLLTPPPLRDALHVAVRYAPAAAQAAIGGDWHDAFDAADGALFLSIGDCVGHDREAAAAMATVRNMLRVTAYTLRKPPAAILTALDEAMAGLHVNVLATALLARVETAQHGGLELVWSNAGHLPPVLLHEGRARVLDTSDSDLLLGIDAGTERCDHHVPLPEGSTLLLFTDGLVERRSEDLSTGIGRLCGLLEEHVELDLEELCDVLLLELAEKSGDDDIAMVAVRVQGDHEAIASGRIAPGRMERSITLPPDTASVPEARRFLRSVLRAIDRPEWADAAELGLSELASNAVLHAHTDFTVTVSVRPDSLRVEVRDRSTAHPSAPGYDQQATTGRGLALVSAVASEVGVRSLGERGKCVWFRLSDDATDDEKGSGPDVPDDLDALAAMWGEPTHDPVPAAGEITVRLLGMPTTLWLAARQHHDALLREVALHRAARGQADTDLAYADRARSRVFDGLQEAIERAVSAGAQPVELPADHPSPLPALPRTVDVVIRVRPDEGYLFAAFQDVLDAGERHAERGELLIRPALPEVIAVRDWAAEQVIAQLGGAPPSPWIGTAAARFSEARTDLADMSEVVAHLGASQGAIAIDESNRILALTPALGEMTGWAPSDLIGRRVVVLVPPRYREAHVAGFTRHLATGEAHALETPLQLPVLHRDGYEVPCRFFITRTTTSTGRVVYLAEISPSRP